MDENDKMRNGTFNPDPFAGAQPANDKARKAEADRVKVSTVREIMQIGLDRMLNDNPLDSMTSGHFKLDQATGGLQSGFIWAMGATTNWGKSNWLTSVIDENLPGKRALIVSSEDCEALYGQRLIRRRSGINANRHARGKLTKAEREKLTEVTIRAEEMPVFISAHGKPFEKLAPRIEAIVKAEGIDLVTFDYLQAFVTERRSNDRRQDVNYISRLATDLVKNQGKAGIILSQLTRDKSSNRPPNEHDLRESQDTANAADVVVLGYTPETDWTEGKDQNGDPKVIFHAGQRYMLLAKNKAGESRLTLNMDWDPVSASFRRVVDDNIDLHDELGDVAWDVAAQ